MIELEQITDYQLNALSLLLSQYEDSTGLQGIIAAKSEQANDLEQAIFEVRDEIYLDVAIGAQLNIIGSIWDVPRAGRNDTEYREVIEQKIALNISGTIPELINILKSLYSATYVEYYPQYPAKYLLVTDADITQIELESISPAGVGVAYKKADEDETYFAFEDGSQVVTETFEFLGPEV